MQDIDEKKKGCKEKGRQLSDIYRYCTGNKCHGLIIAGLFYIKILLH